MEDMEFSKEAPVTADEVTRARTPRMTITPAHSDIDSSIPTAVNTDARRTFAFDAESTEEAARQAKAHPHRKTAVTVAVATGVAFIAVLTCAYLLLK